MTDDSGGTYTLVVDVPDTTRIEVGALGEYTFQAGWYAYTGSAFGTGGFRRVQRHRELAAGDRETRHWHVDYLLGSDGVDIDAVVRSPGADVECTVAKAIAGTAIPAFGASDCDCESHLTYAPRRRPLVDSVREVHRTRAPGETVTDE